MLVFGYCQTFDQIKYRKPTLQIGSTIRIVVNERIELVGGCNYQSVINKYQRMDNIKVYIRSPNKRNTQRLLRNKRANYLSRATANQLEQRFRIHKPHSELHKDSFITLQDYIRGSSPSSNSSCSEVVKIGIKQIQANFFRQPQIQEIDQDNYDECSFQKQIDRSLPKIQRQSNSILKKPKLRSYSRIDFNHLANVKTQSHRTRTLLNQPRFFNVHKSTSGKKSMRETYYSLSLGDNSGTQKFMKAQGISPYLEQSVGSLISSKKRGTTSIKKQNKHIKE